MRDTVLEEWSELGNYEKLYTLVSEDSDQDFEQVCLQGSIYPD